MSRRPIALSPDLKRLQDEGYDLDVVNGYLVADQIPYLDASGTVRRGRLILSLGDMAGDVALAPVDHTALFDGAYPHHASGRPIDRIVIGEPNTAIGAGVTGRFQFSAKPKPADKYDGFHHQVTTYASILGGPARAFDPTASAAVWPVVPTHGECASVFEYEDTASSRADIVALSQRLAVPAVAIVGLGGTGSYVLDLLAKTPAREIHLFDGDTFYQHNAFRSPGAASKADLAVKPMKVDYFGAIYGRMRHGVVSHPYYVTGDNVAELASMSFVFLCMEGSLKREVVTGLEEMGIAFVDVGMGVYLTESGLGGIVRTTTSTPAKRKHVHERGRIGFGDGDGPNEYDKNIQIACLNMWNAAQAFMKWQKLMGFFADLGGEHYSALQIGTNSLNNEEKGEE